MTATVRRLHLAPGKGAYYCEDVLATQGHSVDDAERWLMPAVTPGFRFAREIAETVSVGLELETGEIAWGDCVGVSYGGKAGRDPVQRSEAAIARIRDKVVPLLEGRALNEFRSFDLLLKKENLPLALQYGLSQAGLSAVALAQRKTPAQIVAAEWGLKISTQPLRLQGSSGNDRKSNTDKMIAHRLDALPHTQVDDLALQFGRRGEVLLEFARWVRGRVRELGGPLYTPALHYDVHGAVGKVFTTDEARADFILELEKTSEGLELRLESPLVEESCVEQIASYVRLQALLKQRGCQVKLVVDEWANTLSDIRLFADAQAAQMIHIKMPDLGVLSDSVQAVLELKERKIGTLLGGSCIETDLSSRLSVQIALATQPDFLLVKPGMGVNEGISLMTNEMNRTLALVR